MAKRSACMNNLKQFGVANVLYTNDCNDWCVPVTQGWTGSGYNEEWVTNTSFRRGVALEPSSILNQRMSFPDLLCPSTGEAVTYGYGINCEITAGWGSPYRGVKLSNVSIPSNVLLFADGVDWQIFEAAANSYAGEQYTITATAYRHDGGAVAVFFDGHSIWAERGDYLASSIWGN